MLWHTPAFLYFPSLGYLCEDTDVTEDAVPFSYHSSTTTKVPQNPKSETTEHKSHEVPGLVPGLVFNLLLRPNPGSVLPFVQTQVL